VLACKYKREREREREREINTSNGCNGATNFYIVTHNIQGKLENSTPSPRKNS